MNKTYAMTGGATGIGAAIKQQLRDLGHTVIVVDIKDADIIADLSTEQGCAAAVAEIKKLAPEGLDGFIPCAGLGPAARPHSLIGDVNYFGAKLTTIGVRPLLEKKRGAVVIISSNSAPMARHDEELLSAFARDDRELAASIINGRDAGAQDAYAGSKLALTRWMRASTTEYARTGVRLNAVAPGITTTPLTDAAKKDDVVAQAMADFAAAVPSGREGVPSEIANGVVFLLSDAASFCFGSVFFVDGGSDAMLRPNDF